MRCLGSIAVVRLAALLIVAAVVAAPLAGGERDSTLLDGLRERRLFELAEKYCRDKLGDRRVLAEERAELTVELLRTLAMHAVHAPVDERPQRWQDARAAAREFLAASPQPSRAILVRVQDALTLVAQGELAQQESEVGVLTPAGREQALASLREATDALESLDKELAREVPLRRRTEPRPGELSGDELFSLHQHVRQQTARALRARALLYEEGTDDRLSLLLSAARSLETLLRELPAGDPLAAPVQLELAISKRLLGDHEVSRQLLADLVESDPQGPTRSRALAEQIRLEVAANRLDAARRLANSAAAEQASADVALATLEVELKALRASAAGGTATQQRQVAERIEALARSISQEHGPYWGRRADQLVAAALPNAGGAASPAMLARAADGLFLKGEFDQAVAAYEKSADQALSAGDPKTAFELRYKAALVQQRRGKHADAASRLRNLAVALRTHEQADEAHLLAAWNAAQGTRADAAAAALYADILAEHASIWPSGNSLPQAQVWLGKLLESQQKWGEAFEAYRRVPPDSQHRPAAVAGAVGAAKRLFDEQRRLGTVDSTQLQTAVDYFRDASGLADGGDGPLSETERIAALAAAELLLEFGDRSPAEAEKVLDAALARSADAPQEWRTAATSRLIVALAAQEGKQANARQLLARLAEASPESLLSMIVGLGGALRQASDRDRPIVATLQIEAIGLLDRGRAGFDKPSQRTIDRLHAEALASAGRSRDALALYEKLAQANRDDAEIQQGYAAMLLDSADRDTLQKALDQWRTIAARTRPRTPRWYQAKYSVALAQFKLGEVQAAETLLRYMLETPPGLGESGMERQYRELLERCRSVSEKRP